MTRRIRYGSGAAGIELEDKIGELVLRAVRGANPAVMARLEQEARELYEKAYATWPVKTGLSRAHLYWAVQVEPPDGVAAVVRNDMTRGGVNYIRFARDKAGKHIWNTRVRTPGRRRARKMADDLARLLVDTAVG